MLKYWFYGCLNSYRTIDNIQNLSGKHFLKFPAGASQIVAVLFLGRAEVFHGIFVPAQAGLSCTDIFHNIFSQTVFNH